MAKRSTSMIVLGVCLQSIFTNSRPIANIIAFSRKNPSSIFSPTKKSGTATAKSLNVITAIMILIIIAIMSSR